MKVTTTHLGTEIMLEGNDVNELASFVNALAETKQEKAKEKSRTDLVEKAVELNKAQFAFWEYLVDNDCETGVPIAAVYRHFSSLGETASEGAMGQRLADLARKGYAYRVGRGRYRACEK